MDRWKLAPLLIAFYIPKALQPFQWVPPDAVHTYAVTEVGAAVRSLELLALARGIGLHGIMGVLVVGVGERLKEILKVPDDHDIVYFGVMGCPSEELEQKFPALQEVCYSETWGDSFRACHLGNKPHYDLSPINQPALSHIIPEFQK